VDASIARITGVDAAPRVTSGEIDAAPTFVFLDMDQSNVHAAPYNRVPADRGRTVPMPQTDPLLRTPIHMAPWLDDFAAGRLPSGSEQEIEAHLLVCDVCFAAYVALLVNRA
jgi:hypothetical protein